MQARYHVTPAEAVTATVRETVYLDQHAFLIDRPENSDQLLNLPWLQSVYAEDEYVPYWAQLWTSARMLAGRPRPRTSASSPSDGLQLESML